jgi:hypothetical protein
VCGNVEIRNKNDKFTASDLDIDNLYIGPKNIRKTARKQMLLVGVEVLFEDLSIAIAPSTTLIHGGERVSTSSPAYMNSQKIMDFINKNRRRTILR